jgi:hypothetical protein
MSVSVDKGCCEGRDEYPYVSLAGGVVAQVRSDLISTNWIHRLRRQTDYVRLLNGQLRARTTMKIPEIDEYFYGIYCFLKALMLILISFWREAIVEMYFE